MGQILPPNEYNVKVLGIKSEQGDKCAVDELLASGIMPNISGDVAAAPAEMKFFLPLAILNIYKYTGCWIPPTLPSGNSNLHTECWSWCWSHGGHA